MLQNSYAGFAERTNMSAADLAVRASTVPGVERVLDTLERLMPGRANRPVILMYHRIQHPRGSLGLADSLIDATPAIFEQHMELLARRYRVLPMADLLAAKRRGQSIPPRSVLITFDDAYRDFVEYAWPVLRRLALPVTLFVPTGYPDRSDRSFWWDRLYTAIMSAPSRVGSTSMFGPLELEDQSQRVRTHRRLTAAFKAMPHIEMVTACDQLMDEIGAGPLQGSGDPVLGWADLRMLERAGVSLAPHSRTHPRLDRLPEHMLSDEIAGSYRDLLDAGTSPLPILAYPDGGYSPAVMRATIAAGMEMAVTTDRGGNHAGDTDWFALRRLGLSPRVNRALLQGQLLVWGRQSAF